VPVLLVSVVHNLTLALLKALASKRGISLANANRTNVRNNKIKE
jgi:hypothetical protein